ncbi:STAS domain-containing protein [Candidatus Omnitrophota bacterium]
MALRTENKGDIAVCYIDGEIDINTAPGIKKNFEKVISGKTPKVVINFKDVTYVDSSGLATLVEFLKNIRGYGGKMKLASLSSKVKSLFEITKLEKLFEMYSQEEEAISSFK